jgi:hypothetical protein
MENTLGQNYYKALVKRYEAQIEEAKANLALYFSGNLSAIGEHSDLLAEHDKWVDILASAQDKLETLEGFLIKNKNKK